MKKILFTILTVYVSINAWAGIRKNITGVVSDEDNEPVSFATVAVSYGTAAVDTAFLATDYDGFFKLEVPTPTDSVYVSLKALGYSDSHYRIAGTDLPDTLRFVMNHKSHELSEVVVKGNYYGITGRGDTTAFSVPYFSDGTEHNIGDVIRKIPGMDVDRNGKVSYQGMSIDKILVNGKDVFSAPEMFVNSLPPDFASKLELIDNYTDNDVGDNFRNKSRTALNMKSSAQTKWDGQLSAMGGISDKYATENSIVGLHGAHSLSAIFNANNTGNSLFSILDYLQSKGSLETLSSNGGGAVHISSDEQKILLPPDNEYKRAGLVGNIDYSYSSTPDYQLKVGALFHHSGSHAGKNSTEQYINNGIENTSVSETESVNDFMTFNISNKWNITKRSTFLSKTNFDFGNYTSNRFSDNSYAGKNVSSVGNTDDKAYKLHHEMTLNHRINDGMFYAVSDLHIDRQKMSFQLLTPLSFNGFDYDPCQDNNRYNSFRTPDSKTVRTVGGIICPVLHTSALFKAEIEYVWNKESLSTNGLSDNLNTYYTRNDIASYIGILKNTGLFRYDFGIKAGYSSYQGRNLTLTDDKAFLFQPTITMELFFNNRHRLILYTDSKQSPIGMDCISNTAWITDNSSMYIGSDVSRFTKNNINARLSYRYISLFNRLTLFAITSYTHTWDDAMIESGNDGIISFYRYRDGGYKEVWQSQGYLSKGIAGLPLEAKITPKFFLSKNNTKNSYGVSEIVVTKANLSASVATRFRNFPLNFDIQGTYGLECNKIKLPELRSDITSYGLILKGIVTPTNGLSITLSGKYSRVYDDNMSVSQYDMDLDASYKYKRSTFGIVGQNILHQKNNDWLSEQISSSVVMQTRYRKLPGYLMGYMKFAF